MQYQNRRAALNDAFRRSFDGGRVMVTRGVAALHPFIQGNIIFEVRRFSAFNDQNDPCGEHDFGAIDVDGAGKVIWKIDSFAPDMRFGGDGPANTALTSRVLTIMLAEEY
jgi:hypothetical protein